ncbi:hypothetical protein CsSME_00048964 [Camellia sinensis var. sinensis]
MSSPSQGRLLECAIGEGKAGQVADSGDAEVCDGGGAEGGVGGEAVEEEVVEEGGEKGGRAELVALDLENSG